MLGVIACQRQSDEKSIRSQSIVVLTTVHDVQQRLLPLFCVPFRVRAAFSHTILEVEAEKKEGKTSVRERKEGWEGGEDNIPRRVNSRQDPEVDKSLPLRYSGDLARKTLV